jgi:hypothetical protein
MMSGGAFHTNTNTCTDCTKPLKPNPRRKGTRCQPCATRAMATDPAKREKCRVAMKKRLADPVERAKLSERCKRGWAAKFARDPEARARLIETGRRVGSLNKGHSLTPAGSPARIAAARKQSEFYMAWCPVEYRDDYHRLVRTYGVRAADARQMIEQQIAVDLGRYVATGQLQQSARPAIERGAGA